MSINRVSLSGNLTRDPELRSTQSGMSIMTFGIAVNDRAKNQQTGEWEDRPNFIDCVVFGKRAESLSRFLCKGMKVALDGKLRYSSWEKDGQKRSKIEVVADDIDVMQRRDQSNGGGYQSRSNGSQNNQTSTYTAQGQNGSQNGAQGFTGTSQQQQQYDGYYEADSDIPF